MSRLTLLLLLLL